MDRNEFMELVYETFADEPDNVLANGIIEAADAYVEHEKTQLSQEGTTSDLISRQAALNALMDAVKSVGILDADDIKTVFDALPNVQHEKAQLFKEDATSDQPVATDTNAGNNSEFPNSSDTISRQAAIDGGSGT